MPKSRAPKRRSYTGDFLTRPSPNGNWTVQFRVPTHLVGKPPFGAKVVFKKSLGTKDRKLALAAKDKFLDEVGYYEPRLDRERALAEKEMTSNDFYFEALNTIDVSTSDEELIGLAEELQGQLIEETLTVEQHNKIVAQRDAVWRRLNDTSGESDIPHRYSLTLGEAVNRLVEDMRRTGKASKTLAKVMTAFARYKSFVGSDAPLPNISKSSVRRYWLKLREQGLARGTVSTDLGFLGSAFRLAQDEGFIPESAPNPFRDHRLTGFEEAESRRIFTTNELSAVVRSIQEKADWELMALSIVGYYSGMRISEIFNATLKEKDGFEGWEVPKGKTAAAQRFVPIQPAQKAALKTLEFWPSLGKRLTAKTSSADALGKRFGRHKTSALEALGSEDIKSAVFHSFRHGFITALLNAGYNETEVADVAGHQKSSGKTESSRSYFRGQSTKKLYEMVCKIPQVPAFNSGRRVYTLQAEGG